MSSGDQYRAFIETILGEMTGNAALALADDERTSTGRLKVTEYVWFEYPRQAAEMVDFTIENEQRDVYLLPAVYGNQQVVITKGATKRTYARDRKGRVQWSRSKENALTSNTIYMDSDLCPPEKFRLPPSVHVDTSEDHGHDYWVLLEPVPASEAAEIAHRITTAHKADGTDPTGWSENKVLRMPTVNTKNLDATPYEISWSDSGARYDALDVSGAYDDIQLAGSGTEKAELGAAPSVEGMVPFENLVARIPSSNVRLTELLYKEPRRGEKGWQSEQRWALMLDSLRFGFTPEETVSLVWNAPAGSKWHDDDRAVEGLWMEVRKAAAQVEAEKKPNVSVAPDQAGKSRLGAPSLITEAERARVNERQDFITDYLGYAQSKVPVFNKPLHLMSAWTILSTAFGELAYIPKPGGPMPLNIYSMSMAGSSEGKSEAKRLMFGVINKLFPNDNPDIGGRHSNNALIETLLERQHKVSLIHADESAGRIAEMKTQGWQTGMQELYAHIYDGEIPSIGKVGRKDLSVPDAKGVVIMHMSGTLDGMLKVLERPMFLSGWLPRQIFAIGEKIEITEDDLMPLQVLDEDVERVYERMPAYWSSVFFRIRATIRADLRPGKRQMPVHLTDEAAERFKQAKWKMRQHYARLGDADLYTPAVNRMYDTIWKAAALLALSDGRYVICVEDMVAALSHAERWLDDMMVVAEGIAETGFSRALNDIEKFIATSKNQEAELGSIYRHRGGEPVRIVDEYLTALKRQGRVLESQAGSSAPTFYRIRHQGD